MKKENISLWRERIDNKKASGLRLTDWCVQNQLSKHAYYYWKRKIADLDADKPDTPLFVEVPTDAGGAVKSAFGTLLIEWKNLSIHVTDIHSVNLAAELLTKLQKTC